MPEELRFCFNIDASNDMFYKGKTKCLPLTRSESICTDSNKREQFNALTAFIDGSNVYGSDEVTAEKLRTKVGGEMQTHARGPTLPSRSQVGFESNHDQDQEDLVAGDVRAIEQPGLASMHSLFLNEHNRLARLLKKKAQHLTDEELYQIVRKVIGAELQNIVYSEFLPVVLGRDAVEKYNLTLPDPAKDTVYDPTIDPTVLNSFATVAFRFGHSLIPNQLLPDQDPIRTKSISCPIKQNFFQFEEFVLGSDTSGKAWKNMVRGITNQESPGMDTSLNSHILDFLFCGNNCAITGGFGQDLAARNIQRAREHGIPPYTTFRKKCGLSELTDWTNKPAEINQQDWENFQKVYSNVGDIDPFVGGLAEMGPEDGLVGPTFGCIIGEQFQKLMKGDRFFFTHTAAGNQFEKGLPLKTKISIRKRSLGDIICDNTEASKTAKDVMIISSPNGDIDCSGREGLNLDAIAEELAPTGTKSLSPQS